MFCPRCGDPVEQNEIYCNKCGNYLGNLNSVNNVVFPTYNNHQNKNNKIIIGVVSGVIVLLLVLICAVLIDKNRGEYYFSDNDYEEEGEIVKEPEPSQTQQRSKYSTVIITDNFYSGMEITNRDDAYSLISEDSVSQKKNCPAEIKEIEEEIINKYGVTAVNLCELDMDFSKEIANVFKTIYDEYPSVRGYLTNLSLINAPMSQSYIAAFMPAFLFADSNSTSSYPWVFKTQILLNTSYFFNEERLEQSVKDGSNSGHFPPNATKYSPVAHELGHYLSFLAMMKHHEMNSILMIDNNNVNVFYDLCSDFSNGDFSLSMITEAFENYKMEIGTTLNIDEWRAKISNYAVAKDNNGDYIYDETIAEAFHDVYLNGDNAVDVSKYIVKVLKGKLGG